MDYIQLTSGIYILLTFPPFLEWWACCLSLKTIEITPSIATSAPEVSWI